MYIAKYIIGNTEYNRMHINNCEKDMRGMNSVCRIISYKYAYNWRRFKDRSKNLLLIMNNLTDDVVNTNITKQDVFYNKVKQIFCIGNDLDMIYSMKIYKIRYQRKVCKLKRIRCAQ